jgi:hypothetical protein
MDEEIQTERPEDSAMCATVGNPYTRMAITAIRNDALEKAAQIADRWAEAEPEGVARLVATDIRALIRDA